MAIGIKQEVWDEINKVKSKIFELERINLKIQNVEENTNEQFQNLVTQLET